MGTGWGRDGGPNSPTFLQDQFYNSSKTDEKWFGGGGWGGGGGKKISPQINNLTILRPSALLVRNWLKPRFHSSQKPTRKLTESAFKYCDWMKVLEASLQVGFCDEWKRAFRCLWISCIYTLTITGCFGIFNQRIHDKIWN